MLSTSPTLPLSAQEPVRWFRSRRYDLSLTLGVFTLALLVGSIGLLSREAFGWVLFVDIWLIAHPHLTAMYTRIGFDRKSARQYWFLLAGLLPCVVAGTAALTWIGGVDICSVSISSGQRGTTAARATVSGGPWVARACVRAMY